jgi:hypothetical protein
MFTFPHGSGKAVRLIAAANDAQAHLRHLTVLHFLSMMLY